MREQLKHKLKKIGAPPGTLMYTGDKKAEPVKITFFIYNEKECFEKEVKTIEQGLPLSKKGSITWINIDGIHDTKIIEKLGAHYNIHPLILEDVVTLGQRPKMEDMGKYLYVVLNMIYLNSFKDKIITEQVSLIIGKGFIITLQEASGDVFETIRDRIRKGKGKIRSAGSDYLAYTLIDSIVDNYFLILEYIGEKIEVLEDEMIVNPTNDTLKKMYTTKSDIIFLSKSVWPLRAVANNTSRAENPIIKDQTRIYFRDIYDHITQIIDNIETFRQILSEMVEIYLSSISNKLNEVMKVLTVISTIFIPLGFLAGVWGMNFKYMPELDWKYGYESALFVMIVLGLIMLKFFKDKKWI